MPIISAFIGIRELLSTHYLFYFFKRKYHVAELNNHE